MLARSTRTLVVIAAAILLTCSTALAQTFSVNQHLPSGPSPFVVKTADVNKDGNLDLLWLSNQHDLEVRLGHGDGTFDTTGFLIDTGLRSPAGSDAEEFEVADVNRDGKPDVVVAGWAQIAVLLGNGDGTFGPPMFFQGQMTDPEDEFDSLALADFNHDGKIDAVTGNHFGVQIFFGNGDGTFRTPTKAFRTGCFIHSVEAGDLDHDGNADVVFWDQCGGTADGFNLRAWFGDGVGNFPSHKTVFTTPEFMQLFVNDLNGDGRADILDASTCYTGGCAGGRTWLSLSGRTFARHSRSISGWNVIFGMGVGDFNLDRILDLAVAADDTTGTKGSAVLLFSRNSDGTLNAAKVYSVASPSSEPAGASSVVSGDFNKDGKADLAVSVSTASVGEVQVWTNTTGASSCSKGALYTVHLCSPVDGGTYSSPVPVSATANSDHSITGWKLYVDGLSKASAGSTTSWNTSVAMSSGSHRVTAKAWDSTGRVMSATATITVH